MAEQQTSMWEILVPTEIRQQPGKVYRTRYHQVWDEKVRQITGGLTILTPAKGHWVSPDGELFVERMIPVRIVATREQIEKIIDITMVYYDQLAILCYEISRTVILKHREITFKQGNAYVGDVKLPNSQNPYLKD